MKSRSLSSTSLMTPILLLSVFSLAPIQGCAKMPPSEQAKNILKESGIQGGLIVHVSCGDGILTEALKKGESFLVQGLDPKIMNVRNAREYIASRQDYGPISVDQLTGSYLPYKDNSVNMIVAEDLGEISEDEAILEKLAEQSKLLKGKDGALIWAVSTQNRERLS